MSSYHNIILLTYLKGCIFVSLVFMIILFFLFYVFKTFILKDYIGCTTLLKRPMPQRRWKVPAQRCSLRWLFPSSISIRIESGVCAHTCAALCDLSSDWERDKHSLI